MNWHVSRVRIGNHISYYLSRSFRIIYFMSARLDRLGDAERLRRYRNTRLYRSLGRILRVYNRRLIEGLRERGFEDFAPSFPALLSNLDVGGTRIGVLAARAGVTRQAAGQLLREIRKCGYVELRDSAHDARVTTVHFTAKGKRLLSAAFELVDQIEGEFAEVLGDGEFKRVRGGVLRIADRIDHGGRLGEGDRGPDAVPRRGVKSRAKVALNAKTRSRRLADCFEWL